MIIKILTTFKKTPKSIKTHELIPFLDLLVSSRVCIAVLFSAFALGLSTTSLAQTARVLIVGDSWAQLQFDNNTHNQIFSDNGYAQFIIDSNSDAVATDGSRASDWAQANQLQLIGDIITTNPQIDTVQLTIGGNDFLEGWNINLTLAEKQDLQQQIKTDITTIVQYVLSLDSRIEVILSFYDYPNFVDTISGTFGATCNGLLTDMGTPSVLQLNSAAREFEQVYAQIATSNSRVFHVSHFGLMQSYFGFPDLNIPPGSLLPPGDASLPSPLEAMRDFIVARDCFHLSPLGYQYLVQNSFDGYFHARFDTVFQSSFE